MCGITGFFNTHQEPASSIILQGMTDAIAHRGPDGEGIFTHASVGLGHRRLAILDLSPSGKQPKATADGRYVITFNGEIYNYRELRRTLETQGYVFTSQTDTEVLLYAYQQWGKEVVHHLNGMFAFAIYDCQTQQLFLARDRYGIKPLYYANLPTAFLFGSEIKAILAHPAYNKTLDKAGLIEYFTFQNFFSDRTLFQDVHLLPPGCHAVISPEQSLQISRYWDYQFVEPDEPGDEQAYIEELDRLFQQAVTRQLVSDVEVGSYLSGGMDSGAITAIAAQHIPYIKTFTLGFDLNSASGVEINFDERSKAEQLSHLLKTEQYEMVLKSGDMQRCLPQMTWHLEEPRIGQSYPNFYISRLASKFLKVVLAGTGGDELFAGYPWRYYRALNNTDFDDYIDKYYMFWQRLIPNRWLKAVFEPIEADIQSVWTRDIFKQVFEQVPPMKRPEDAVNASLYFEAKTFMHGLLVVEDKLSMAHGLETRVPFLDNDLVDFAMRLPTHLKLAHWQDTMDLNENLPNKRFIKSKDGKRILRQAMAAHVPSSVTQQDKQGFSAPDASWFKGESIDYVRSIIDNPNARLYDVMAPEAVQTLVRDHMEGRENRRLLIWSLLYFNQFCETFF